MIINCAYNLPHICNIILVAYYCYAVQWLLWWMLITHIHKIYLQYSSKKLKDILDEKFRTLCFKNVQLNFQSYSAFQAAIIIYCGIYETQKKTLNLWEIDFLLSQVSNGHQSLCKWIKLTQNKS